MASASCELLNLLLDHNDPRVEDCPGPDRCPKTGRGCKAIRANQRGIPGRPINPDDLNVALLINVALGSPSLRKK